MGSAMTIGLAMGGLSGLSAFGSAMREGANQRARAAAMEGQAEQYRRQAQYETQKGRVEAEAIDRRKSEIRRNFTELQARNRNMLATGNVDMTSGSALDVSQGNIDRFASDIGENAYQKALREYEAKTQADQLEYQARQNEANASYLKKTAGNLGTSLISGLISGGTGFLSGYSLGGGSISRLLGGNTANGGLAAISPGKAAFGGRQQVSSLIDDILKHG